MDKHLEMEINLLSGLGITASKLCTGTDRTSINKEVLVMKVWV